MLSLEKYIEPGSLRDIGCRLRGVEPHQLPIACRTIEELLDKCSGEAFMLDRFQARNAFVWVINNCSFLYVRPDYSSYRKLARKYFPNIPAEHDVDHVLARKMARQLNLGYSLVAIVPSHVNRSHGWVERLNIITEEIYTPVCFIDKRILHKALHCTPTARQSKDNLKKKYDPSSTLHRGLSLKQRGIWGLSLGFDQHLASHLAGRLRPYLPTAQAQSAAAPDGVTTTAAEINKLPL